MCFLSSALVVCVFGITGAHAAPSVKMLGANTAKIGTNAAVVKSDTDSNVPTQRLGSIRSKTVNNAAPVTVNRLTSPSVATDSGSDARLSLGKYIHSTGISAGTIKPAAASLPSAEVSSSDFVSLSDHVRDLERSLEGYYTKDEIDGKVADIIVGDMDDVFSGKQDTIEDLENIRSGAAAGATAVQPEALTTTLNNYALTADVPTKTSELTNDSGFLTAHQDISGKADKADVYTKSEVDTKVANIVAGDMTEALSGKQDTITDLGDIRSGAAAGATAVQPAALTTTLNNYALTADVPTKTSELTNDSGFLTEHQDISGLIANPTLPMFSGDYLLKVNLSNSGNYTYSWAKASDYSGGGSGSGGSGSGGSSGGSDDDCDPNWDVCD
jgi:hypothetical protein